MDWVIRKVERPISWIHHFRFQIWSFQKMKDRLKSRDQISNYYIYFCGHRNTKPIRIPPRRRRRRWLLSRLPSPELEPPRFSLHHHLQRESGLLLSHIPTRESSSFSLKLGSFPDRRYVLRTKRKPRFHLSNPLHHRRASTQLRLSI